jgi:hypothetical protein
MCPRSESVPTSRSTGLGARSTSTSRSGTVTRGTTIRSPRIPKPATPGWPTSSTDPDRGDGLVVALRRPQSPTASAPLRLRELDAEATYELTDPDQGTVVRAIWPPAGRGGPAGDHRETPRIGSRPVPPVALSRTRSRPKRIRVDTDATSVFVRRVLTRGSAGKTGTAAPAGLITGAHRSCFTLVARGRDRVGTSSDRLDADAGFLRAGESSAGGPRTGKWVDTIAPEN